MNQIETRNHNIKCNYGVIDYLNHYKETIDSPEEDSVFRNVLKDYLKAIKNIISTTGYIYILPERMGRIELRKSKKEVFVDNDGKVVNKLVINWKATKALWEENEEAKKRKIKIRYINEHTKGYVFKLLYIKNKANYKNKSVYKMLLNREMRRNTYPSIMNNKMDAFLLNSEIR